MSRKKITLDEDTLNWVFSELKAQQKKHQVLVKKLAQAGHWLDAALEDARWEAVGDFTDLFLSS